MVFVRTVCQINLDLFHIVNYYIDLDNSSCTCNPVFGHRGWWNKIKPFRLFFLCIKSFRSVKRIEWHRRRTTAQKGLFLAQWDRDIITTIFSCLAVRMSIFLQCSSTLRFNSLLPCLKLFMSYKPTIWSLKNPFA